MRKLNTRVTPVAAAAQANGASSATPEQIFNARMEQATDEYVEAVGVSGGTRRVISMVLSIIAGWSAGYAVIAVTQVIVTAAVAFTGFAFIGMTLMLLGCIVTLYAAWKAAAFTFGFCEAPTERLSAAKSTIGGWFSSSKAKVVAASTGASDAVRSANAKVMGAVHAATAAS